MNLTVFHFYVIKQIIQDLMKTPEQKKSTFTLFLWITVSFLCCMLLMTVPLSAGHSLEDPPKISISVVPGVFFKLGETVDIFVHVEETDGKIISGTSVNIVPQNYPEDAWEVLTDAEGTAQSVLKHDDSKKEEYIYSIYVCGTDRIIKIPILHLDAIKKQIKAIPVEEESVLSLAALKNLAEIRIQHKEESWGLQIFLGSPQQDNRDLIGRLKAWGPLKKIKSDTGAAYSLEVPNENDLLINLIQAIKILSQIGPSVHEPGLFTSRDGCSCEARAMKLYAWTANGS